MKWSVWIVLFLSAIVTELAASPSGRLIQVPTADVLEHGAFRFGVQARYNSVHRGTWQTEFPFTSGLVVGVNDRAQLGVQMGGGISFSGRMRLLDEEKVLPALSLGTRAVFGSPEANLFNVADSLVSSWTGDVYMVVSKELVKGTRVLVGASVIPGLDSGAASPFFGVEQDLGGRLSMIYDGFSRLNFLHQAIGLGWKPGEYFEMSVGMTELQAWFYQDGEVGFFFTPSTPRSDSYRSPGLFVNIALQGWMVKRQTGDFRERLRKVEDRMERSERDGQDVLGRLDRAETQLLDLVGPRADSLLSSEHRAEVYLAKIVKHMDSDDYDPVVVRALQDSILALGESAHRSLGRMALSLYTRPAFRENALRIMGNSGARKFRPVLEKALENNSVKIRREALLALGSLGDPAALPAVRSKLSDGDSSVVRLAIEVEKQLAPVAAEEAKAEQAVEKSDIPLSLEEKLKILEEKFLELEKKNLNLRPVLPLEKNAGEMRLDAP